MSVYTVKTAEQKHFADILQMNEELVHFLSPLNEEELKALGEQCEVFCVAEDENGRAASFLMALREGTEYKGVNYKWFSERYDRFLYVDRVVVSPEHHRKGLGKLMYNQLFKHAKDTSTTKIALEINAEPPNPVSMHFHANYGFKEVGLCEIADGKKTVSMQIAAL